MTSIVVVMHAVFTLMMAGLIWFVQLVHYPLFAYVGAQDFGRFEKEHVRRTTWIVGPLMMAEGTAAVGLLFLFWSSRYRRLMLVGLLLLVVIWVSTAFIQVPCHRKLDQGLDLAAAHRLARTNWIRTAAWTARGVLAIRFLQAIQP